MGVKEGTSNPEHSMIGRRQWGGGGSSTRLAHSFRQLSRASAPGSDPLPFEEARKQTKDMPSHNIMSALKCTVGNRLNV